MKKVRRAPGQALSDFSIIRPLAEPPDADYPFLLLTGRGTSSQWHTQTRASQSAVLRKLYPADPYVELHPTDAARQEVDPHSRQPAYKACAVSISAGLSR